MSLRLLALLVALAASALLALAGCDAPLAGMHDVELTYAIQGTIPPATDQGSPLDVVKGRVAERLAALHVTADVEASPPNEIRVTVDADSEHGVDGALRWPSGLVLDRPADDVDFVPKTTRGLQTLPKTPDHGASVAGTAEALARAVGDTEMPKGLRALIACEGLDHCRVEVAHDPPAFDLGASVEGTRTVDRGRAVEVQLAKSAVDHAGAETTWIVARGRTALARGPLPADGRLVVRFGDDIYAYTLAAQADALLSAHPLPPMLKTGSRPLPARPGLAVLGLVLPLFASLAWLSFVRRFDRAHPEPMWLVLATFFLGALSVVPAGLAEYGAMAATPYLNPSVMTLGGQILGFPTALIVFTLVVGFSEEGSKLLATVALARQRSEFDEPIDGIVYGTAAALGFAAAENVKYFAVGRLASSIVVMRSLTSVPVHMFFGAIWGYALGRKLVSKKTSLALFFLWAAAMHGAFDTFLSIRGLFPLALATQVALALLFVHFLRKSLRYGVVDPGSAPPASSQRMAFTLGSMSTFGLWVGALVVFAIGLVVVGGYFEISHHRLSYGFVSIAVSLLALIGVAAHGVASSVPLDVVLDVDGITFAGTLRRWEAILGIERRASRSIVLGRAEDIVVRSREGDLVVGPARGPSAEVVYRAAAARLPPRG